MNPVRGLSGGKSGGLSENDVIGAANIDARFTL
jgi:hypothetical protein